MNNTKNALLFGGVSMILLTVVAISFAYFSPMILSDNSYSISGTVDSSDKPDITLTDTNTGVTIANKYPMKESVALATVTPYNFTVTNNSTTKPVKFDIIMETMYNNGASDLEDTLVRTSFGPLVGYGREVTPTTTGYKKAYVIKTDYLEANASKTYDLRVWIDESADNSNATNKNWTGKIVVSATSRKITAEDTIAALGITPNTVDTPNFNSTAPYDVQGVFEIDDDYGPSYYYRGNITDNYVKFGKYPSNYVKYKYVSEGKTYDFPSLDLCEKKGGTGNCTTDSTLANEDMYWRIIRINGDGSMRIIYDGTSIHTNGEISTDRVAFSNASWEYEFQDAKLVGYMFDGASNFQSTSKAQAQTNTVNSNIKNIIDTWYEKVFLDSSYEKYISDVIFCNDRGTSTNANTWDSNDTTLGYAKNITFYSGYNRVISKIGYNNSITPSLICAQKNDAFTVDDTIKGNGNLTYPVGLITEDDAIVSGLTTSQCLNNYLRKGVNYWTMTPYQFYYYAYVYGINLDSGTARYSVSSKNNSVAPVINLSAEAAKLLIGDGTAEDPYRFE